MGTVYKLYLHCGDSLNLNWCGVNNALLFQAFQNRCRQKKKKGEQICHEWLQHFGPLRMLVKCREGRVM